MFAGCGPRAIPPQSRPTSPVRGRGGLQASGHDRVILVVRSSCTSITQHALRCKMGQKERACMHIDKCLQSEYNWSVLNPHVTGAPVNFVHQMDGSFSVEWSIDLKQIPQEAKSRDDWSKDRHSRLFLPRLGFWFSRHLKGQSSRPEPCYEAL